MNCRNPVIFNDGEIISPPNRKKSTLGICFDLPECASCTDELTADYPARRDLLLLSFDDESKKPHPQQDKDADIEEEGEELFDFSAEFNGAFGLMEKDEAGMGVEKNQATATSPSREDVVATNSSSPRSVISPKVFDSTPTKQQQQQQQQLSAAEPREVFSAKNRSFADDNASQATGNATRKPISIEGYSIGDEAKFNDISFDISKEDATLEAKSLEVGDAAFILRSDCKWTYSIVIDKVMAPSQSALRFEVDADNSRKTFLETQWGKYVRVIKTTKQITVAETKTTTSTAVVATAVVAAPEDPDLSYYESDSDEDILNDYANQDAVDTSSARPTGILRNKSENALDRYLKSKVVERNRSEGNAGYSVQFNMMDDAASWTSNALEQAFGTKKDEVEKFLGSEEKSKPEPVELFPAKEIQFVSAESDAIEVGAELADIKDETSSIEQSTPSIDEKEDSLMQKPNQLYKKGLALFNSGMSPISPASECASTPSKIGESWDVGQLLFLLADMGIDLNNSTHISQEPNLASTPLKNAAVPKEDVVDESLTIECELQRTDVKVHEVYVTSPSPPAALQAEHEDESKADVKVHNVRMTSSPPTVFQGGNEDAIQSANDLSLFKRNALDIHKGKGIVKESLVAPTLNKRDRSIKNKLRAYTVSRVLSSKKSSKVNITADTIDSYEVTPVEQML